MDEGKIKEKLKKLKALAERGFGKEKDTALRMYEDMKRKYSITDMEVLEEKVECEWFRYKYDLDKKLLNQICYMVTGANEFYKKTSGRYKLVGHYCTKFEKDEIEFYFEYYKAHLKKELELFYSAFCGVNHLYPSEDARCYIEYKNDGNDDINKGEAMRIEFMAAGMEIYPRPLKRIGAK